MLLVGLNTSTNEVQPDLLPARFVGHTSPGWVKQRLNHRLSLRRLAAVLSDTFAGQFRLQT